MRRWMMRVATLIAMAASVAAAAELWISVGSYRAEDQAERGRAELQAGAGQPLSVAAFDLHGQRVFRVVAGPYAEWRRAAEKLAELRSAGFPDAWVIDERSNTPASVISTGTATPDVATSPSMQSTDLGADWTDLDHALDGLSIDELLSTPYPQEPVPTTQPTGTPFSAEVTTEAPDGYRLHRLHRDGE